MTTAIDALRTKTAALIAYTGRGYPRPAYFAISHEDYLERAHEVARLYKTMAELVDERIPFEVRFE